MGEALPKSAKPAIVTDVDRPLVGRAQRGDRTAMAKILGRHERAVFALLRRALAGHRSPVAVEDLAQEVFLRAFRGLDRFDPDGRASFKTWLLTIASRAAIDELRRKRERMNAQARELPELRAGEEADTALRQRRLLIRLQRELEAINPDSRIAFLLYAYHDLSYKEIARALEVELGTVKSRIARVRRRLEVSLKEVKQ